MSSGHVDKSKPLRPLTDFAWQALESTARGPVAGYIYNAGVWDRLMRERLVDQAPHDSRLYVITDAGREKLKERP